MSNFLSKFETDSNRSNFVLMILNAETNHAVSYLNKITFITTKPRLNDHLDVNCM